MKKQLLVSLGIVALVLTAVDNAGAGPNPASLGISPQSPAAVAPGNTARFLISVSHAGNGNLDTYLHASGLPAGAAASFSPGVLRFTNAGPGIKFAVLTVNTATGISAGEYPFTIVARHGSGARESTRPAVLALAEVQQRPVPVLTLTVDPDRNMRLSSVIGAEEMLCLQATEDLSTHVWTTISTNMADSIGLYSVVDLDSTNYPMRFYRLAPVQ